MRRELLLATLCGLGGCAAVPPPAPLEPGPARPWVQPSPDPAAGRLQEIRLGAQAVLVGLPPGYPGAGRYPLLLFFHSYQRDAHQISLTRFPALALGAGYVLVSADLGGPTHWGQPRAIALVQDLLTQLRGRYQLEPRRTYFAGFSMGGGTALLAAMELPPALRPAAVASSQGWSDLVAMRTVQDGMYAASIDAAYQGGLTPAERRRGDLRARASELAGVRIFLEHGEADAYVPPSHSSELAARLTAVGLMPLLRLYPDLGHAETTIHEGAILEFFGRDAVTGSAAASS